MPFMLANTHKKGEPLPRLIRFLGLHMAFGMAVGVAFASIVVLSNISGLKDMMIASQSPYLALFMLLAMNALTFASLAMGIAVMTLPMGEPCDMRDPHQHPNEVDRLQPPGKAKR